MLQQEKLSREQVLQELGISDDTLSLYELELEINSDPSSSGLNSFTSDDLYSIRLFHKLRESGLTTNEIKLMSTFSDIMKNVNFEGHNEIKTLLKLSPVFRLKQSLNLTRQELNILRKRLQDLEEALKKETDDKDLYTAENVLVLQKELSEVIAQKTQLEAELLAYKERKTSNVQTKSKKAKELYNTVVQNEKEITELKKKNEELSDELSRYKGESVDLTEKLELLEDGITEMEQEVEERYQEQIDTLRERVEGLVEKKQKEWEAFYIQSNEQHRKELLTLQRKHEQEILRLKIKIKEQIEELEQLKINKNPLLGLLKLGSGQR